MAYCLFHVSTSSRARPEFGRAPATGPAIDTITGELPLRVACLVATNQAFNDHQCKYRQRRLLSWRVLEHSLCECTRAPKRDPQTALHATIVNHKGAHHGCAEAACCPCVERCVGQQRPCSSTPSPMEVRMRRTSQAQLPGSCEITPNRHGRIGPISFSSNGFYSLHFVAWTIFAKIEQTDSGRVRLMIPHPCPTHANQNSNSAVPRPETGNAVAQDPITLFQPRADQSIRPGIKLAAYAPR